MDRNKVVRDALKGAKNRKAVFEKTTEQEEKAISIAQEDAKKIDEEMLGVDDEIREKNEIIRKYLYSLIAYNRKKSEVQDIHYTIEKMKEDGLTHWKSPDQYISLETMESRLQEHFIGMRVSEVTLFTLKRQVFEAYHATQEEVDEIYHKLMGKIAQK